MDYLNQISGANNPQPVKQSAGGLFSKKFIFIMGGLIVLAILIMILGSILGKTGNKDKDVMERINIRLTNLMSVTQEYGKQAKSSNLRSMNASLYSVLNSTSTNFTNALNAASDQDSKEQNGEIASNEEDLLSGLKIRLDKAKLNGLLDRTYSYEITLQISLLMSLETEAIERTKDDSIKNILSDSHNNLTNLYTKFSEYSDATNNTRAN